MPVEAPEKIKVKGTLSFNVDPKTEYVSGGSYNFGKINRALPWAIDDLTTQFGANVYDRMMRDPQVHSAVQTLKLATIGHGLNVVPAVKDEEPEYDKAKEFVTVCQRQIDGLKRPFVATTLYSLLDAIAYGNKVAELIWEIPEDGPDKDQLVLCAIKVKPRRSVAFVVDPYMNVVGMLSALPSTNGVVLTNAIYSLKDAKAFNILPRDKFVIFTPRESDSDPRGDSYIRSTYNSWWMKLSTWEEYMKYLAQFAGPSLIGILPEDATRLVQVDAEGNPVLDASGMPIMLEPQKAMMSALEGFKNGSIIVIPFGAKVDAIKMEGEGDAFLKAIELFNREISKGATGQTLATEEGQHNARAASQTHQDVLGLVIQHLKVAAEAMIRGDIFSKIIEYNYGKEWIHLTPKANLGDVEAHDFATAIRAIATLFASGYLHPSQFAEVDGMLNLPPRDPKAIATAIKIYEQNALAPAPATTPAKGKTLDNRNDNDHSNGVEDDNPSDPSN